MKKYKVFSKSEGFFVFGYDEVGELCYFERVGREVRDWLKFMEFLPTKLSDLERLRTVNFQIEEIQEVTFENFWSLYDDKRDKVKTKAIWDKLSERDRKQYFDWVKPYFKFLQEKYQSSDWTLFKKMAKTYLSRDNKPWEDEAIRRFAKK